MLVRINGGNKGVCEYLEKGYKQGREYTRDEIDHRLVLDGDLALTESVIDTIPDNGQERYIHITLSFLKIMFLNLSCMMSSRNTSPS